MKSHLGIVVVLEMILIATDAFGQITSIWTPPKAEKPYSEQSVPIVLHAAAESRPALKYQLLPPFPERRPGNAAVWWNRLPAEQEGFFVRFNGSVWEKVEKWMEIPIGDPREREHRPQASELSNPMLFSDIEHAARFESVDWELPVHEGKVMEMRLPDLNQSRMFGGVLSAKARLEIAEGKYDQAVRTLQTGFAWAGTWLRGRSWSTAWSGRPSPE